MKIMKSSGFAGSLLLVGALMFSGGCGYKNAPVPPQTVVPKVIEDLRYNVGDDAAALTWSYPTETVSGKNITEITSFELFRAEVALADVCNGCPIPFGEPLELPGGVNSDEKRRVAEYESGMLRSGYQYFFKVRSRTSWWASSDDSNIATFVYYTLAAAPQGLQAMSGDNKISLKWAPVTSLIDGKPADLPLRYQIMRSTDGKEFDKIGIPVAAAKYDDTKVETGKKYYYKVKSNMLLEDNLVQGSLSDSVSVAVADMTPPPMVTEVTVVSSSKNNRIFWDRVKDQGLAGYRVYRRAASEKTASFIGEASATQTIFVDDNVPKDTKLYYSVTAFDNAKPANESKRSKEATTRH
jgi:hypothetical protein